MRIKKKQYKRYKITPEMEVALKRQLEAFRAKFGRDPGPDDPVFFDTDSATPVPMSDEVVERATVRAMTAIGLSPAYIHAYSRTGRIVTTKNYPLLSPEERAEWDAAIAEYREKGVM